MVELRRVNLSLSNPASGESPCGRSPARHRVALQSEWVGCCRSAHSMSLTSQICEILQVYQIPLKLAQTALKFAWFADFWKPSPSENSEPPENWSFLVLEIGQRECDFLARTTLTWMASVGLAVKPADRPGFPESRRSDSAWDTQRDSGLGTDLTVWSGLSWIVCRMSRSSMCSPRREKWESRFDFFRVLRAYGPASGLLIQSRDLNCHCRNMLTVMIHDRSYIQHWIFIFGVRYIFLFIQIQMR
jgi:hypothetical protein